MLVVKSYGLDSYNQETFKELASTVKTNGGGDSLPKVIAFVNEITIKVDGGALRSPSGSETTKERNA